MRMLVLGVVVIGGVGCGAPHGAAGTDAATADAPPDTSRPDAPPDTTRPDAPPDTTRPDAPPDAAVAIFTTQAYLKDPAPAMYDDFGYGVALSADGSTLAVGALQGFTAGYIDVFVATGSGWTLQT